ncbi:MAG: putative transposase [Candidatus Cloacimonadota bacterium]|nr:putative transposase [Candidatus Cloacimonadota bacterium]
MHNYPITVDQICSYFAITRQGYYKHRRNFARDKLFESKVLNAVKLIRADQPQVGCRKLQNMISTLGITVGRDRLFNILRKNKMLSKVYRRKFNSSSNSGSVVKYPNLVKAHAPIQEPGEIIASDITVIYTRKSRLYLALTSDYFSDYVLGYSLSKDFSTKGPLSALVQARKKLGKRRSAVIHHSDHGSQYTSNLFQDTLRKYGYKTSMTGIGKCYDNPKAERINGILKHELGLKRIFRDYEEALLYVRDAIKIYNEKRIITTKEYRTPNEILNVA